MPNVLGLVLGAMVVAAALAWAIGTAHVSVSAAGRAEFEPITFYIRCAIYHDKAGTGIGLWTMGTLFLICGLAGHWLWGYHPRPPRRRRRLHEDSAAAQRSLA